MPSYLVTVGHRWGRKTSIPVVGDSPEGAKRTCERAGLEVMLVDHRPIDVPDPVGADPIAQLQDEVRQTRALLEVMSVELRDRTGVWTVLQGCMLAALLVFVLMHLFNQR